MSGADHMQTDSRQQNRSWATQAARAWLMPLALLVLLPAGPAHALRVHEVDYASQADLKVFRVDYASQADLRVFRVRHRSEARGDALWWSAPYASDAEVKIYYVRYASEADLKVFEVRYASEAGWNGPPRGLGIR